MIALPVITYVEVFFKIHFGSIETGNRGKELQSVEQSKGGRDD